MNNPSPLNAEALLEQIAALVREHEKQQGRDYYRQADNQNLPRRVEVVIEEYERIAVDHLAGVNSFRNEVLIFLRALGLAVEMAGKGGTHAEKEARHRGVIELLETIIGKLEDMRINLHDRYWRWPDVWTSDYPVLHYKRSIYELERQLKAVDEAVAQLAGERADRATLETWKHSSSGDHGVGALVALLAPPPSAGAADPEA